MSSLHEVIYNIVSNPHLLARFEQHPQLAIEQFDLSPSEFVAIKSTLMEHKTWQHLLSIEALKRTAEAVAIEVNIWIPPVDSERD